MMIEETFSSSNDSDAEYFKVQHKVQAQRSDIVSLRIKSKETGAKFVQKAQLVVKDGLPAWAGMIVMKQVAIEAACGDLKLEDLRGRRDEIVSYVYNGTWVQAIEELQEKYNDASTNKPMLRPDPEIIKNILEHNHLLPVQQLKPKSTGQIA